MESGVSDSERRREIARRTRAGLDEDFQDMRAELADDLETFEQRIRRVAGRAPEWISVDPRGVVELFEVEDDDLPEAGFLGPRMVAIAAGVAEQFVEKWLPDASEEVSGSDLEFDDETLEEFDRDLREILAFLDDVRQWSERRAGRAHRILEEWMETNLAYLDELRENDIEALKELVGEGSLETGPDARAERAQLWDEQRKRADELADIWDRLHELIDQGTDGAIAGLEELEALVDRACQGLAGAYPGLERSGVVGERFREHRHLRDDREEEEEPPKSTNNASGAEEAPSAASDESSETEPQWLRGVEAETSSNRESTDEDERGAGAETVPVELQHEESSATDSGRTVPARSGDGASPIAPPEASEPTGESESASDFDSGGASEGSSEDEEADPGPQATEHAATPSAVEPEAEIGDVTGGSNHGESAVQSKSAGPGFESRSDEEEAEHPEVGSEQEGGRSDVERFRTECLRIRTEWRPVELSAVLAALGPPVGFLAAVVGIGMAHLTGVQSAPNPVARWNWVEPAVGVALGWCLLAPLLLGWRPRWSGWSFSFVHEAEVRDEGMLEVDRAGLSVGKIAVSWNAIDDVRRARWQTRDGDMAGWLLVVESEYYEPIEVIAPIDDRTSWEQAAVPLVETPTDAWQVAPGAIAHLHAILSNRR